MLTVAGGSSTSNDVSDNNGCKKVTFIFARGTTEMGNMGSVVGPKVGEELNSFTNNGCAVQGVDYPADAAVYPSPFSLVLSNMHCV